MKKLFSILLIFALLIPGATALAEEAPLHLGYIAPMDADGDHYAHCAGAFAYAAERKGVSLTSLFFDPGDGDIPDGAESVERMDPALAALTTLIEDGVDGVAVCAASVEQALAAIDLAQEAGLPIVIEGPDVSSHDLPLPGAEESRPCVAVGYGDAPAYAAAMWLDEFAYNPLLLHCTLPQADPAIKAGIRRALGDARYLSLADNDVGATANTARAGRAAVKMFADTSALFGCVLADSESLAEGCAQAIRKLGESFPVAAIASSDAALELLRSGKIDMLAAAPASVEGVQTFKALCDLVTEGILPESETAYVQLNPIVATKDDTSAWIGDDDYETAYALTYPEDHIVE